MTICSLIGVSPFYDCSETWEIRIYDTFPQIQCNALQDYVNLGCANIKRGIIHVVKMPEFRDEFGDTIIEHELKHLQCKCNFHG